MLTCTIARLCYRHDAHTFEEFEQAEFVGVMEQRH